MNGAGKCDPTHCPLTTSYQQRDKMCVLCQRKIAGHRELKCVDCRVNGKDRCDIIGESNHYN